jgi:hypothetical protein
MSLGRCRGSAVLGFASPRAVDRDFWVGVTPLAPLYQGTRPGARGATRGRALPGTRPLRCSSQDPRPAEHCRARRRCCDEGAGRRSRLTGPVGRSRSVALVTCSSVTATGSGSTRSAHDRHRPRTPRVDPCKRSAADPDSAPGWRCPSFGTSGSVVPGRSRSDPDRRPVRVGPHRADRTRNRRAHR